MLLTYNSFSIMSHENREHKLFDESTKINMLAELDALDVRVKIPLPLDFSYNSETFWVEMKLENRISSSGKYLITQLS